MRKEKLIKMKLIAWMFILLIVSSSFSIFGGVVDAQTSVENENIFGEQETGESIVVEAYSYQPKAVPTNILEAQDVPVYVFLKATTLGGLVIGEDSPEYAPFYGLPEIKLISNPVITGGDRRYVTGITFVPSNKERRSLVDETGRFIDLGYFIVRLKKIDKESELPGFRKNAGLELGNVSDAVKTSFLQTGGGTIDLNVSIDLRYNLENSVGGWGANDLLLLENGNENEWKNSITIADSFWNGKGYVRADRIDERSANIVVYDGRLNRLNSFTLSEGQESNVVSLYSSGFNLVDRFRIRLQNIEAVGDKARLSINNDYVLRGRGERLIAGSDWSVERINNVKQVKDGGAVEEVYLKNVKTGQTRKLSLQYGGKVEEETREVTRTISKTEVITAPLEYNALVVQYANEKGLDVDLVKGLIQRESGWKYDVISPNPEKSGQLCGAVGLMQLMPDAAAEIGLKTYNGFTDGGCNDGYAGELFNAVEDKKPGEKAAIDERFNPAKNIEGGTKFLKNRLNEFKDEKLALAAYNAGSGNIKRVCGSKGYDECKNELDRDEKTKSVTKYVKGVIENKDKYAAGGGQVIPQSPFLPSESTITAIQKTTEKIPKTALEIVGEMRDPCLDVADFGSGVEGKSALDLYCKSILELKRSIPAFGDDEKVNEAYYFIGENYNSLGAYGLALDNYQRAADGYNGEDGNDGKTYGYKEKANIKIAEVTEKLKGKVIAEGNAYLDDEGLDVKFFGIRALGRNEGANAYISVNNGKAEKYGLGDVLKISGLNDKGRDYRLVIENIERVNVFLRKIYDDGEQGEQINLQERGKRVVDAGVKVSLEVVDIESKDNALVTILPGSGKAISRSNIMLHIPIEQRAIQFSSAQIDKQINMTNAMIKKLDGTINRMDSWLRKWKLACISVYGFLSLKNLFIGGKAAKARDIVYRGENGRGVDDVICNEKNIGFGEGKLYRSYDECVFKNRKLLEGFVDVAENKVDKINSFSNSEVMKKARKNGMSKLNDGEVDELYNQVVGGSGLMTREDFRLIAREDGVTTGELVKIYENKELLNAYENELSLNDKGVKEVIDGKRKGYETSVSGLRNKAAVFKDRGNFVLNNEKIVGGEFAGFIYADQRALAETKISEVRVYKKEDRFYYYNRALQTTMEVEPKRDDKKSIISGEYVFKNIKDEDYDKPENNIKTNVEPIEFGNLMKAFYEPYIKVDGNGRVLRMPYKNGEYIDVLEWYQNGEPKTLRLIGFRNVGGEVEEVIVRHESDINREENRGLKLELARHVQGRSFCKPGDKRNIDGKIFNCKNEERVKENVQPKCTDVMSANDCAILFNVCDPVICPASRFDLGGRYRLPAGRSVVDTGLFGAVTLGMPNFVAFGGELGECWRVCKVLYKPIWKDIF